MLSPKFFRHFLAPLVLFLLAAMIIAHSSRAAGSRWDSLLDQGSSSKVKFTAMILGPSPFERDPDGVLPPAQITQLFTAGAALEKLGPDYRFETRIEWRNPFPRDVDKISDLTVLGSGDPSWGMAEWNETELTRFDQIAQILKDQNVREVHGPVRLLSQDPRWDQTGPGVGWLDRDLVTCEGAVPQAINVQLNCATYVVSSPAEGRWREEQVPVPVKLDLEYGTRTVLMPELDGDGFRIRGTWADNTRPTQLRLPVRNAREWAQKLLELAIESKGIRIRPRSELAQAPGRFVLASHSAVIQSPPLKDLVRPLLKDNQGLIAESLFVLLGGQSGMRAYLDERLPQERTLSLWDGSGLSRSNTASARSILSLLTVLGSSPHFAILWDGLPVAGLDGTLASRLRDTPAEGLLRAKTGSLPGYFPIAGYVPRFDGAGQVTELVPFVITAQAGSGLRGAALSAQDRVGVELVKLLNY